MEKKICLESCYSDLNSFQSYLYTSCDPDTLIHNVFCLYGNLEPLCDKREVELLLQSFFSETELNTVDLCNKPAASQNTVTCVFTAAVLTLRNLSLKL